jgi:multidrug resistance protein MdtO
MRRILVATESACAGLAFGRPSAATLLARERGEAATRIHMLGVTKVLLPAQATHCHDLLQGCNALIAATALESAPDPDEKSRLRAAARWLRKLRFRVLLGDEAKLTPPAGLPRTPALRNAFEKLAQAATALIHPTEAAAKPHAKPSLVPADFTSNPLYASFATRAALATTVCYVFMTLTDWGDIHTCMITCVVTALTIVEDRELKQKLRIVGATLGGILGTGAVIFFIPRFDSFAALLLMLAAGTALAAWVTLGGRRVAYAGWQIALAFYMTILQEPHPVTKLDVIWDRWVGIVIGILAMRAAFSLPSLQQFFPSARPVIPRRRGRLS